MAASPFEAKLEAKYRKLKQRVKQLEEERDAAEDREQRLRDTLEEEISRALVRRSKSLAEKVKAAEASTNRARKECTMLKKELRDTHEMFKIKLNKERDVKMSEVSRNEKAHSQLESAKKPSHASNPTWRSRSRSLLNTRKRQILCWHRHRLNCAYRLPKSKKEATHKEKLNKEKEARFAAEAKKRTALHKLKEMKEKLAHSIEDRSKNDLKFSQLHERLSKATMQGKQRLAMVKTAQNTVKQMQEQCDKTIEAKEKAFKAELRQQKQKISRVEAEKKAAITELATLKETIEAEKSKDEKFRQERLKIEQERDDAKASIEKYIELAERCRVKLQLLKIKSSSRMGNLRIRGNGGMSWNLRLMIWRGKLTLQEIRYGSLTEQLDEKQIEFNELKNALATRGISLDFVLQSAKVQNKSSTRQRKMWGQAMISQSPLHEVQSYLVTAARSRQHEKPSL